MRISDLLRMAFRGLLERKLRTALALLGVVIASVLIILCLAASEGVQDEVVRQFNLGDRLRRIEVYAGRGRTEEAVPPKLLKIQGKMSAEKRERIRRAVVDHWNRTHYRPRVPLTEMKLKELRAIPHVAAVEPEISLWLTVLFDKPDASGGHRSFVESGEVRAVSMRNETLREQIVAGRTFSSNDDPGILVHEYLAYRWGYPGDDDVKQLLGKTVRLEVRSRAFLRTGADVELTAAEQRTLNQIAARLPQVLDRLPLSAEERRVLKKAFRAKAKSGAVQRDFVRQREFTIVGIYREPDPDEEPGRRRRRRTGVEGTDLILAQGVAEGLVRRIPGFERQGFNRATVIVADDEHVEQVAEAIKTTGLNHFALIDVLQRVRFNIRVITYIMAVLGAVALFVAGLGIANTMVMTVLERTHEIGVMKAVGARDGDVQRLFLAEGAVLGLLGGLMGLLAGWAVSFPVNDYVAQKLESEFRQPIASSLFAFPWWLTCGVPLFAAVITMLAAVYPARRAAKVDPIVALRHE